MSQLTFQRARTAENKRRRAATLMDAGALAGAGIRCRDGDMSPSPTGRVCTTRPCAGTSTPTARIPLQLAAEGWQRWSDTVCAGLAAPGPISAARVAATLSNGLAADPLFCDLLAYLPLHLEHATEFHRIALARRRSG